MSMELFLPVVADNLVRNGDSRGALSEDRVGTRSVNAPWESEEI